MRKYTVVSSNSTEKGDGFITKLQWKESKTVDLGFANKTQDHQETFYIKLDSQVEEGILVELDLDKFEIKERAFTTDEGETIQLKWLFLK